MLPVTLGVLLAAASNSFVAPPTKSPPAETKQRVAPLPKHLVAALAHLGEPVALNSRERKLMARTVAAAKRGDAKAAQVPFGAVVRSTHLRLDDLDVNALIMMVLRESYLDNVEDLRYVADKVAYNNAAKKQVRDHLKGLRGKLKGKPGKARVSFQRLTVQKYVRNGSPVKKGKTQTLTVENWGAVVDELEGQLDTLGEDSQLVNMEFQDALQKEQETFAMLTKMSKMLHDTMKSIIGDMRD